MHPNDIVQPFKQILWRQRDATAALVTHIQTEGWCATEERKLVKALCDYHKRFVSNKKFPISSRMIAYQMICQSHHRQHQREKISVDCEADNA